MPEKEIIVGEGNESASVPQVVEPVQKEVPARTIENKPAKVSPPAKAGTVSLSWTLIFVIVLLAFLVGALIAFLVLKIRHRMARKQEKKKPLPDLYPF